MDAPLARCITYTREALVDDLIRQLPKSDDDGRLLRTVGDWGAKKYLLALRYAEIMTQAMKGKWSR